MVTAAPRHSPQSRKSSPQFHPEIQAILDITSRAVITVSGIGAPIAIVDSLVNNQKRQTRLATRIQEEIDIKNAWWGALSTEQIVIKIGEIDTVVGLRPILEHLIKIWQRRLAECIWVSGDDIVKSISSDARLIKTEVVAWRQEVSIGFMDYNKVWQDPIPELILWNVRFKWDRITNIVVGQDMAYAHIYVHG
jgi:hypothetical protein